MSLNSANLLFALVLSAGITSGCQSLAIEDSSASGSNQASLSVDTLYKNANVWTGDPKMPFATQFAVSEGKIVYVSKRDSSSVEARNSVDMRGQFVMPGFIDNHVHFFDGGYGLASVDLRDATTPDEFSQRIVRHAKSLPAGRWITIGNWDHTLWGGELPHRSWIDAGTANTPVFVMRIDGHMALANSAALKLAGVDEATAVPPGGEIILDKMGKLSGVLKDEAMLLVQKAIPKATEDELLTVFQRAQSHALSLGLTQVHSVSGNPTETEQLKAFQLARKAGVMKIRAKVYAPIQSQQDVVQQVHLNGPGDEVLGWAGVKGLVDGSLGSGTAWFKEPYSDEADNRGFPLIQPKDLIAMLGAADQADLQLAIHAIGDLAIDELLNAYEDISGGQAKERRFRIEHFQHPSGNAIKKLAKLGVIASVHPYHAIDDGRWLEERIGAERAKTTYPFRSIIEAGGILSFGSDWPVAPLNPLDGVYAAVTRRTLDGKNENGWQPQEKISVSEALTAYTTSNAYSVFEEEIVGTIEKGKRADFVVLSANLLDIDPSMIREIRVLATVIGGELVYGELLQ